MDTAGRVGLLLVDPAVAPQPDPRVRRASRISHRSDVQAQGRSRDEPGCSSATCLHARSWPGIQLQVPLANLSDPFPHPRRAVGAGGVPVVGPGPRPASRRGAQDAAAGRASQWILVSFGHAAPRAHETLGVRPRALEDGGDAVVPPDVPAVDTNDAWISAWLPRVSDEKGPPGPAQGPWRPREIWPVLAGVGATTQEPWLSGRSAGRRC